MAVSESATLCADVVVFEWDKVLLIKRGYPPYEGSWALPGGKVDEGETFAETAVREAGEETGLDVTQLQLVGIYDDPERDPRGRVVSVAFVAVVAGGAARAGDDAVELDWFQVRDVLSGEISVAFDHHRMISDAVKLTSGWRG